MTLLWAGTHLPVENQVIVRNVNHPNRLLSCPPPAAFDQRTKLLRGMKAVTSILF